MTRRNLMMTGAVAGSIGLGAALGVTVLAPTAGLAAAEAASVDASIMVCAGVLGSGPIGVASETIGIEPEELLEALRAGRTIAEVAEEHGVAPEVVIDEIVAALREGLDEAVDNGWITQERADERAAELEEEATRIVNGDLSRFPFPRPGGDRDRMPGGPGWFLPPLFPPRQENDANTAEPSLY